ncbi:MAG: hypothetical protein HPY53_13350 [Brevinematales bacterium]|nr:hypothetical protein [Brevinematales bacterium]
MKVFKNMLFISIINTIFINCAISKQTEIGIYGVLYDDDVKMGSVILPYNDPLKYSPYNLFDKNKNTALALNTKNIDYEDTIKNNYFIVFFTQPIDIDKICILNGYQKSDNLFYENERVKKLQISFYNSDFKIIQIISNISIYDIKDNQKIIFPQKINTSLMLFEVTEHYSGIKYQDLCISEIELWDGNEKYEIGNLEEAKKQYINKLIKTYAIYLQDISFDYTESIGFLETKEVLFSKWKKLGIKTDNIYDIGELYNRPGFNTRISFEMDKKYSGSILIQLKKGKNMQIGNWKIDDKGAIWIKVGNGIWKAAEDIKLAGTDLGTIEYISKSYND